MNRKLSLSEALSARQDAIELRREMIAFGRWSEAGQLLMLAADVSCMLDDPEGGEQLLGLAERGLKIELYEAHRRLGGRATSFFDSASGEWIDHCKIILIVNLPLIHTRTPLFGQIFR